MATPSEEALRIALASVLLKDGNDDEGVVDGIDGAHIWLIRRPFDVFCCSVSLRHRDPFQLLHKAISSPTSWECYTKVAWTIYMIR